MRFKRVELSPANKRQYLIALGVRDIELMLGEALNAAQHTPPTKENKHDRRRLNAIVKGLRDALKVAESDRDNGTRIPVDERDQYSDEDTGNPLEDITRLEIIDHRPCSSCRGRCAANYLQGDGSYKEMPCDVCSGMGAKGREIIFWDEESRVTPVVQDKGKTLKLFLTERGE